MYLDTAMPASAPARKAAARGRRNPRANGDERESAILATAERLLEERPLREIAVEGLARGAGISRPTFYFYFPSKDAVVLTLVEQTVAESESNRAEALALMADDPRAGWRLGLRSSFEAFGSRRGVVLAAGELRASNAEARELWSRAMEDWVADASAIIEAERARGAAPPGEPARELATALLQMNERVQHTSLAGDKPSLDQDRLLDVLADIWVRAIYGTVPSD